MSPHKYLSVALPVLLLLFITFSCGKEASVELSNNPVPNDPAKKDTITAIVVDGNYSGFAMVDYDSAIIRYGKDTVTIRHYNRSAQEQFLQTIIYDDAGRVRWFKQVDPNNSLNASRLFVYTGADSIPHIIMDTLIDGPTNENTVAWTHGKSTNGSLHTHDHNIDIENIANPIFSYTYITKTLFRLDGRMHGHINGRDFSSTYFYNAAGDADSCKTETAIGDDTYHTIQYSGEVNPLHLFARALFKNLEKYQVTDQIDNSLYESFYSMSYIPSELLTARIPTKSNYGRGRNDYQDEATFQFNKENGILKNIVVTHRELPGGATSKTNIRFHRL